jgi:hypothetical protein
MGKGFFSISERQGRIWGHQTSYTIQWVAGAIFLEVRRSGLETSTHLHLVPRPKIVNIYLHSPIRLLAWCLINEAQGLYLLLLYITSWRRDPLKMLKAAEPQNFAGFEESFPC